MVYLSDAQQRQITICKRSCSLIIFALFYTINISYLITHYPTYTICDFEMIDTTLQISHDNAQPIEIQHDKIDIEGSYLCLIINGQIEPNIYSAASYYTIVQIGVILVSFILFTVAACACCERKPFPTSLTESLLGAKKDEYEETLSI